MNKKTHSIIFTCKRIQLLILNFYDMFNEFCAEIIFLEQLQQIVLRNTQQFISPCWVAKT